METNENKIPHMDEKLTELAEKDERNAIEVATNKYLSLMFAMTVLPMNKYELEELHTKCTRNIFDALRDRAVLSGPEKLEKKLEAHLEEEFSTIIKLTEHRETPELSKLLKGVNDLKYQSNAYIHFMKKLLEVVKTYCIYKDEHEKCNAKLNQQLRQLAGEETPSQKQLVDEKDDKPNFAPIDHLTMLARTTANPNERTALLNAECTKLVQANKGNVESVSVGWDPFMQLVFVTLVRDLDETLHHPYTRERIKIVHPKTISQEGRSVLQSIERAAKPLTETERKEIEEILPKISSNLMDKHSNLTCVSSSSVRSRGFGTEYAKITPQTCITLYVTAKGIIPVGEETFEQEYEGYPVDVREGLYLPLGPDGEQFASKIQRPLVMGCKIQCKIQGADGAWGTLGAFVDFQDDGETKTGCLTCAHVIVGDSQLHTLRGDQEVEFNKKLATTERESYTFYQPLIFCGLNPEFGRTRKCFHRPGSANSSGLDVGLIEIEKEESKPKFGQFPAGQSYSAGYTAERPIMFTTGAVADLQYNHQHRLENLDVVKYGAKTGLTRGIFTLNGTAVCQMAYDPLIEGAKRNIPIHRQLVIEPVEDHIFAENGDSGSLVLVRKAGDDLEALGILVGRFTNGTFVVTPMTAILQAFSDMHMVLKKFPLSTAQKRKLEMERDIKDLKKSVQEIATGQQRHEKLMHEIKNLISGTS